jgi:hypothetical protein
VDLLQSASKLEAGERALSLVVLVWRERAMTDPSQADKARASELSAHIANNLVGRIINEGSFTECLLAFAAAVRAEAVKGERDKCLNVVYTIQRFCESGEKRRLCDSIADSIKALTPPTSRHANTGKKE